MKCYRLLALLCTVGLVRGAIAEQPELATGTISYAKQIEPIFRNNCQGCHQPAKAQGDYVMTDFSRLLGAGESGEAAIVAGKPEESFLLDQITPIDGEAAMPKKGTPLHKAEIELIRKWIEQGAVNDLPPEPTKFDADNPPRYSRAPLITSIAVSPDGKWIASSGFHEVFLVNTATWQVDRRLVGLSERIESISFSPDSSRVAVTGGSPGRMGEVQIWDVASGELQLSHQVTYDTVYGGCFSPDGKLVAFGCSDNTVRAIDANTGEQKLHQGAHEDWIRACVFNPSGSHLLSAGRDMTVKLTEVATERFVDNVTSITPGALRGGVNALAMHPERDEVLVGGAGGIPKVYRIFRKTERRIGDDANLIRQFPTTNARIFGVDVAPDGKHLAVASTLDGKSRVQVYPYDFEGTLTDEIKDILKKTVSSRSADQKKLIQDTINDVSDSVVDVEITASLYAIAYTPDSSQLVVGGSDGLIRVLDALTGELKTEFNPAKLEQDALESQGSADELLAGHGMAPDAGTLPNAESEKDLLPNNSVVELRVQPESITLASRTDYAQLVVTAVYEDGKSADVTRACELTSTDSLTISDLGLVRARSESENGRIDVRFGGREANIEVAIGGFSHQVVPDFVRDVNPVLSRLGCNAGTCHGAQKGKNGFKLSLRGYDPVEDVRALSDDLVSRRLNSAVPDASLMLLKPTGAVPHEGGVLFKKNSVHYNTLRDWIAGGAKLDRGSTKVKRIEIAPTKPVIAREGSWQQFRVVAHFDDGITRDVTHEAFIESGDAEVCKSYDGGRVQAIRRGEAPVLVRYEGAYAAATVTVMGQRDGFVWEEPEIYSRIDELVSNKWERMKIKPSPLTNDNAFLRRVRLDLTGLPPSSEELRKFLKDRRPSILKRMAKIEELIGSDDYVEHWANKWADLLQVNSKFLGKDGAKAFRQWIRKSVQTNQPYDEFARSVLTASGSNKENPAASYYKILRDPDLMMENTTHLFLAIRFNCNKCHDHPFERWTQDQYYELAAYFAQTGLRKDAASGDKKIGGTAVEGAKPLYEEVFDRNDGEMEHARTGKPVAPAFPFACDHEVGDKATRRERLAAWITSKNNPYFARSYVNRLWGYLTGTGLMEPLDDIRAGNPPTNPELMDHLTEEFIESGFDTQHILRLICNSRTYQLSVESNSWNDDDALNYSHAKARRLPAEVLYDAVYRVTGAVSEIPGVEPGTRAAALPDVAVQLPDGFLNNLGRPVRESACECERSQELQLGPVMALVSGPTVGKAISDPKCALPELAGNELTEEEMVREIFLRVLSREASEEEVAGALASADQIAVDHQTLQRSLEEREAWWKKERQRREQLRLQSLEETKAAIAARQEAIAPEREKQEAERTKILDTAEKKLKDYDATLQKKSQEYLKEATTQQNWFPLVASSAKSTNNDKLLPQADRSIVASGNGRKTSYTVQFRTPLTGIRGFRLEALTNGNKGPGLADNGNFVVTEISAKARSVAEPKTAKDLKIISGHADFSQSGFGPAQVFDGKDNDQRGWAVSPRGGSLHWATFGFEEPVGFESGTILEFRISQNHDAKKHRLARFRISVTTDKGDLQLGLPDAFVAAKNTPAANRSKEQLAGLVTYLQKTDGTYGKLLAAVAKAKKPLPEDAELVGLRTKQKLLEVETPDDAKLVQLRQDFDASKTQVANRKLTLAQDLTWALINSPAFLFNH